MRVSLSIPEGLFRASADLARRLGVTRAMLYGRAIEEYLGNHGDDIHINPLIKAHVEPVLVEEMERYQETHAAPDSTTQPTISSLSSAAPADQTEPSAHS